jgi:hypothetical protein
VHAISVPHTKFADNAAGWVLKLFDVRMDDKGSGDNPPKSPPSPPTAHTDDQDQDDHRGGNDVPMHGGPRG